MVTLLEAVEALNNRMKSVAGDAHHNETGFAVSDKGMRLLLVGTGIDMNDLEETTSSAVVQAVRAVHVGQIPLEQTMAGLWVEGVLTGVLLEQLRTNEKRREEQ